VHIFNGTAIPLARALVALLENYAKEDGKVEIPKVLRPYMNNREEI
jgi:seryl-tRNA synthetase